MKKIGLESLIRIVIIMELLAVVVMLALISIKLTKINELLSAINDELSTSMTESVDNSVEQFNETTPDYTEENVMLLARLIYGEARGECFEGQVAVGAVVLNRMKTTGFPNTMEEVIFQKRQFSCVDDGQFYLDIPENSSVYAAAREALNGADPTNGCTYFYNPKTSTSSWVFENTVTVMDIGNHRFAVDK